MLKTGELACDEEREALACWTTSSMRLLLCARPRTAGDRIARRPRRAAWCACRPCIGRRGSRGWRCGRGWRRRGPPESEASSLRPQHRPPVRGTRNPLPAPRRARCVLSGSSHPSCMRGETRMGRLTLFRTSLARFLGSGGLGRARAAVGERRGGSPGTQEQRAPRDARRAGAGPQGRPRAVGRAALRDVRSPRLLRLQARHPHVVRSGAGCEPIKTGRCMEEGLGVWEEGT